MILVDKLTLKGDFTMAKTITKTEKDRWQQIQKLYHQMLEAMSFNKTSEYYEYLAQLKEVVNG